MYYFCIVIDTNNNLNMDPIIGGALIGVGSTLLGGLLSSSGTNSTNATNLQAVRETNQANMDLAKYQYEQNLEQWNRENAYNTPAAQMRRFATAGLNPNLIYNQSNTASQSPAYDAPTLQAYHQDAAGLNSLGSAVSNAGQNGVDIYLRSRMQEQQLQNMVAQKNYTEAQTATEHEKTMLTFWNALNTSVNYKKNAAMLPYLDRMTQLVLNNMEQTNRNLTETNNLTRMQTHATEAQIDNIIMQNALYRAQTELTKQQKENLIRQLDVMAAQINNFNASARSSDASAVLSFSAAEINNLRANLMRNGINPDDPIWARILGQMLEDPNKLNHIINNLRQGLIKTVEEQSSFIYNFWKGIFGL